MAGAGGSFIGCVAMWWMYVDTSSGDAAHVIEHSKDPGLLGACFHYLHVMSIGGVIVCAVGDDLVVAHPLDPVKLKHAAVLVGGPVVHLQGNSLFKRVVYGRFPRSHGVGMVALLALLPMSAGLNLLTASALTTTVMVAVTAWEARARRRTAHGAQPAHTA